MRLCVCAATFVLYHHVCCTTTIEHGCWVFQSSNTQASKHVVLIGVEEERARKREQGRKQVCCQLVRRAGVFFGESLSSLFCLLVERREAFDASMHSIHCSLGLLCSVVVVRLRRMLELVRMLRLRQPRRSSWLRLCFTHSGWDWLCRYQCALRFLSVHIPTPKHNTVVFWGLECVPEEP